MTQQFDYDVFISYSGRDREWARGALLKRIEEGGLRAFIDFRDFKRGSPSIREVERGVLKCRKILSVLTPNYIESEWCELEVVLAQTLSPANRDLRLIPLLRAECERPLSIRALTHIDFTDGADLDLAWHQLMVALDALPEQTSEDAIPLDIQVVLERAKSLTDADKHTEAIPILEDALMAADGSGHTVARVKARLNLACALFEGREDSVGAERNFREALALVPIDNVGLKHGVLKGLGDMLLFAGRLDEAKATVRAALGLAQSSGDRDNLALSLISCTILERDLGFHDSAISRIDEAIDLLHQESLSRANDSTKSNAGMLAVCYINKAALCRDVGVLDEALALYGKAQEQHRISGDKLDAGKALLLSGELYCSNADWDNGFDCFQRAMGFFREAANPLWLARGAEHIARLYAAHEKWPEAVRGILGAVSWAEESGNPGEQVHFLCSAAGLLRSLKIGEAEDDVRREIQKTAREVPENQRGDVMSTLSATMGETFDAIEQAVRGDLQVRELLNKAKDIAKRERLRGHLANCLLTEIDLLVSPSDTEAHHNLTRQAIELLREEFREAQAPNRRGHLAGRICALYIGIGERAEASSWLSKAREVFEKSGDVLGLSNYFASLAEMHRADERLADEIGALRDALSTVNGRDFHDLAAGLRIRLAEALRYNADLAEAQRLLGEAEALCERYHLKGFTSAIARNRSAIEDEQRVAQAPMSTLSHLLGSLDELVKYRPPLAIAYLPFWYYAWKTELLALVRSGPHLSFMVMTNDVERFMGFTDKFRHIADHFLMATDSDPAIKIDAGILPIPPKWGFPPAFPMLFMKRGAQPTPSDQDQSDAPPSYRLAGPARILPAYVMTHTKSAVNGAGMMALSTPYLPQEAIDLMINRQVTELIRRRAVWFPTDRFATKDPLLYDLRIGRERAVFPVYLDRLPTSEAVAVRGGVEIAVSTRQLADDRSVAAEWRRAMLRLIKLPNDDAEVALLDLSTVLGGTDDEGANSTRIEIWLFEFNEFGRQFVHPALLIRE